MSEREQDPEFLARIAPTRAANLAKGNIWTPERRERHRQRMIKHNADPAERERKAALLRQLNADPERRRQRAEKRQRTIEERSKDPAYIEQRRQKLRAVWTPEARAAQSKKLRAVHRAKRRAADAAKPKGKRKQTVFPQSYKPPHHLRTLYRKLREALGYRSARAEIAKIVREEKKHVAIQTP